MKFLNNLNVQQKLYLPIIIALLAIVFFFYQGYSVTSAMKSGLIKIHSEDSSINKNIRDIYIQMHKLRTTIVKDALSKNIEAKSLEEAEVIYQNILSSINKLNNKEIFKDKDIQKNIDRILTKLSSYYMTLLVIPEKFYKSYEDGSYALNSLDNMSNEIQEELSALNSVIDETLKINFKKIESEFSWKLQEGIYVAIIAIVIFIVLSLLISNNIKNSLSKLNRGLSSFFDYLNQRSKYITEIELKTSDEFGKMANILNENIAVSTKIHEDIYELNHNLEKKIQARTSELENLHKQAKSAIEYASLIQSALIPKSKIFFDYFDEHFSIWQPRDMVGGDIFFIDHLRHDDECLIMVADCTGHGVPGAFVTMLVKAIERQIVAELLLKDEEASPALILKQFNRYLKELLGQHDAESISNVGLDGGIIYYNKRKNIIKYASSNTPLFIERDGEIEIFKGDRQSIGYIKSKLDYEYKEYLLDITQDTKLYVTTDGYLDQNGGEKGFSFGKKRFQNILRQYHEETLADIKEVLLIELMEYMGQVEKTDDMCLIGLKVSPNSELKTSNQVDMLDDINTVDPDNIIFYIDGKVSQELLVGTVETLEQKFEDRGVGDNILMKLLYVTTEVMQNIINHSSLTIGKGVSQGICMIALDKTKDKYFVLSKNHIKNENVSILENKLNKIVSLDKEGLKQYHKELRRSGEAQHARGAGLGLIDCARKSSENIEYKFRNINQDDSMFEIKIYI